MPSGTIAKNAALAVLALGAAAAPTAPAASGGAWGSKPAAVNRIECVRACAGLEESRAGSLLRIRGRSMQQVATVTFLGSPGRRDDVEVRAARSRLRSVDVRVPKRAVTGRVLVHNKDGTPSRPSRDTVVIGLKADDAGPLDTRVAARRVYVGGTRAPKLTYMVRRDRALDVGIQLVRAEDGAVVASWTAPGVPPGQAQSVTWDGKVDGQPAPEGRYQFRAYVQPTGASAAQDRPVATASFVLLEHVFPVRGPHDYGGEGAVFGTSRGSRSHQGQDVFAKCGTPLVAARGGTVRWVASHRAAGHYLVIAGEGTGVDYAYMHLVKPAPFKKGDSVRTGQRIGEVGDSGNARGCHLHFELWSAPGWYEGGKPFDPLPSLKAWDAQTGRAGWRSSRRR